MRPRKELLKEDKYLDQCFHREEAAWAVPLQATGMGVHFFNASPSFFKKSLKLEKSTFQGKNAEAQPLSIVFIFLFYLFGSHAMSRLSSEVVQSILPHQDTIISSQFIL